MTDCYRYLFLEARTMRDGDTWIDAFPMDKITRCDGSQTYQRADSYPIAWETDEVPLCQGDVILVHPEIEPHGKWCRLYIHAVAQNQAIEAAVAETKDVSGGCEFGGINDGMTGGWL